METQKYNPIIHIMQNCGEFSSDAVFSGVNEDESEIVELLLGNARKFGKEYLRPLEIDAAAKIPVEIIQKAGELGFFGLTIAPEFGGAGLSLKGACRVIEELARFDSSTAVTIGLHCGLGLRGLNHYASADLQARYLPDLASGKKIAAFAATEPEAGSHIANIKTTAFADETGKTLILNGSKIYVTNGGIADVYTLLVSTPGLGGNKSGHTLVLLPRGIKGLTVGPEEKKLGLKGSSTTSFYLDNVKIGVENIIGEPGKGMDHFAEILIWGRTLMSAGSLGSSRSAFAMALEYATVRRQFNAPIGTFGLVKQKISAMRRKLFVMEAMIKNTARNFSLGNDITGESTAIKIFCSEEAWNLCDSVLQIHGGSGFIEETGVARILRDARITRIFEGTNEVLRCHLGIIALTWNRDALLAASFGPGLSDSLAPAVKKFLAAKNDFVSIAQRARKRHGFSVIKNEYVLGDAGNAAISLYGMLSALILANGLLGTNLNDDHKSHILTVLNSVADNESEAIRHILSRYENSVPEYDEQIADFEYEQLLGRPLSI